MLGCARWRRVPPPSRQELPSPGGAPSTCRLAPRSPPPFHSAPPGRTSPVGTPCTLKMFLKKQTKIPGPELGLQRGWGCAFFPWGPSSGLPQQGLRHHPHTQGPHVRPGSPAVLTKCSSSPGPGGPRTRWRSTMSQRDGPLAGSQQHRWPGHQPRWAMRPWTPSPVAPGSQPRHWPELVPGGQDPEKRGEEKRAGLGRLVSLVASAEAEQCQSLAQAAHTFFDADN